MPKTWNVFQDRSKPGVYRIRRYMPHGACQYHLHAGNTRALLQYTPRVGVHVLSYDSWRDRDLLPVTLPPLPEVPNMKRMQKAATEGVPVVPAEASSKFLQHAKPLLLWCSETRYDDGTPRVPGTLRIATRGTVWSFTLTDPDSQKRLCVVGLDVDEVLKTLIAHLTAENAPWEHDPYASGVKTPPPRKKG